jgi:uncharacterized protein GlcG (DUF336 family)
MTKEITMQQAVTAKTHAAASITLAAAKALIESSLATAKEIGIDVTIAITDAAGNLKSFERTDNAPFLTVDVAIDKAWTAASFGLATHTWNTLVGNPELTPLSQRPRLLAIGGGYPIVENGKVVGAIGVSGGNVAQDRQIAEQALKSIGFDIAG